MPDQNALIGLADVHLNRCGVLLYSAVTSIFVSILTGVTMTTSSQRERAPLSKQRCSVAICCPIQLMLYAAYLGREYYVTLYYDSLCGSYSSITLPDICLGSASLAVCLLLCRCNILNFSEISDSQAVVT